MKAVIALFSYGGIEGRCMDALLEECRLAPQSGDQLAYARIHDDALISRSRSYALSAFLLDTSADVFIMVDHDIEWEPGMLMETCRQADMRKCMVAGMYSTRRRGAGFAGRSLAPALKVHPGVDEMYPAEYLPGGFMAIPRMVAEEVLKVGQEMTKKPADPTTTNCSNAALTECFYLDGTPFYDFFRPIVVPSTMVAGKFEYLSEDWAFSWRARFANKDRPQYLWAKPILLHWGQYGYSMFEAAQAVNPALKVRASAT